MGPPGDADRPAAVPPGAAVGDGLPAGGAGRRPAGAGGVERLGLDPAGPALGAAGSGRARRPDARPGPGRRRDPAGPGGVGVPAGGVPAAALRLARGGALLARRRPRPDGQRPAQLRGRRAGRDARLPARAALARGGARPDGGAVRRLQPEPAAADAGGHARHAGALRRAGGAPGLRLARAGHRRGAAAPALGRGARHGDRRRPGDGPGAAVARRPAPDRRPHHPAAPVLPQGRPAAPARRPGPSRALAILARLARAPGAAQRPGGHRGRPGRRLALVHHDGPLARLAGHRRPARPARAAPGRLRPDPPRPTRRAGPRDPAPRPLRRRPGRPQRPGRRGGIARIGGRCTLGDLVGGGLPDSRGLAAGTAERVRPDAGGPAEPPGVADDRGPGPSPRCPCGS